MQKHSLLLLDVYGNVSFNSDLASNLFQTGGSFCIGVIGASKSINMSTNHIFQVEQQNIYKINQTQKDLAPIEAGSIRLKVDKFGLTTNNITYAVSGVKLKYWNFYPTEAPYGIIPVWGYGDVVESKHAGVKVGERFYGYFPMTTYCTLQPIKVNPFGFADGTPHRQELASVYNRYSGVAGDPFYKEATENYQPIIRPLFATSFLLYQFLNQEDFLGADQVMITSASAKTSLGLAYMLRQHKGQDGKTIIGLTSSRNVDFVQSTAYYDTVLSYEQIQELPKEKTVIVDISGNFKLLQDLSSDLGDLLQHIALVGLTDWKAVGRYSSIEKTAFFFAPTYFKSFFQLHGPEKGNRLLNEALAGFIEETKQRMELEIITDLETLSQLYLEMVDGKVDPKKGYIVQVF